MSNRLDFLSPRLLGIYTTHIIIVVESKQQIQRLFSHIWDFRENHHIHSRCELLEKLQQSFKHVWFYLSQKLVPCAMHLWLERHRYEPETRDEQDAITDISNWNHFVFCPPCLTLTHQDKRQQVLVGLIQSGFWIINRDICDSRMSLTGIHIC